MELKKPTTYEEQIELLRSRGLVIEDEAACRKMLQEVNYYRFTAYLLPFRQKDSEALIGASFEKVRQIYEFDKKLRGILFSAVEEVEVFFRAKMAYFHAHKFGPEGYMDASNFNQSHNAERFLADFQREVESNKRALCVQHHIKNYDGHFPIWAAVELFSFGMLSRFYCDLKTEDQKALAKDLFGTNPKNAKSWLRCCTDLRNICAHYGRLYYRIFTATPAGDMSEASKHRLWGAVFALKQVFPDIDKWNLEVLPSVMNAVAQYKDAINLYHMAFPRDWGIQLMK